MTDRETWLRIHFFGGKLLIIKWNNLYYLGLLKLLSYYAGKYLNISHRLSSIFTQTMPAIKKHMVNNNNATKICADLENIWKINKKILVYNGQ